MAELKENPSTPPVQSTAKTEAEKKSSETARKPETKKETPVKKNTFFQKALRQFLLALLFLAIGAGLVFFLVHQPATKEYNAQKEEALRLQNIEAQYATLQEDYADLKTRHDVAITLVNIYQIQNNVNIARIALMDGNDTRLSIALGYVETDIETLDIGDFPEKIDLNSRVTAIKGYLPNNTQKALEELNSLFDDLLLLANNLEITE